MNYNNSIIEPETKVTEFRAGDEVRILKSLNFFGESVNFAGTLGRTFILKNIDPSLSKPGEFQGWNVVEGWGWVRSDDIELVSRPSETIVETLDISGTEEFKDLLASNERLSDANEAKRERLEAIRAIITADDVESLKVLASGILSLNIANICIKEKEKLPKYEELLERQETSGYANFSFTQDEHSESGFGVNINVKPDQYYEPDDLEEFADHLQKLAKRMRKKIAKSYAN